MKRDFSWQSPTDNVAARLETQAPERQGLLGPFPPSFSQQRLWFFDQLEPGSSVYNLPGALRLRGALDVTALEKSLNEIIRRHEVLRTTLAVIGETLSQVITSEMTLTLQSLDLRGMGQDAREAEGQRLAAEEACRPFDLSKGPLMRATLLRLDEEEHILLCTMHHIVSDGWSMGIFFNELSALYEAFSTGKPSPLPELPIQYADFAVWQRQWLQGEVLEEQLSYWKKQLTDLSILELPIDRPRSAAQTFRGAEQSLLLPQTLTHRLKALSQENRATLFMTLLAAFNVLLHRYTGQDDVVVGSPIAGRNRAEIEGLIGFFVNNLVLRTDLSGNPTFHELLGRVRTMALNAYAHQDLPFEKLVEQLQPKRDLSRTPLFQVFFNMLGLEVPQLSLRGLSIEPLALSESESKFDVTFYIRQKGREIFFELVYNTDLFQADTAARMLGHFYTLLEGIVAHPDQRLSELPILTTREQRQLLADWNNAKGDYPQDRSIHQLFEAQAERTPDAVALAFESRQLTYKELNARANQLARHLRKRGVGSGTLVGVCVERSFEMVIGMLAVLKTGAAYVPLDPFYPKERLVFMLADTGVRLLLTQNRLLQNLPEYSGEVLCLDRDRDLFAREEEINLDVTVDPDQRAYVIYTSGSTGKPKGILSRHRGAVHYFSYLLKTYHLKDTDTILQIPSISFDASVRDIFGSLVVGARVILVKSAEAKDPAALLATIREHRVTSLLSIGPTMLTGMIEAAGSEPLPYDSVRLILVSGDVLHLSVCRRAKELFGPQACIVNQYGPTEATMTSTYQAIVEPADDRATALIGKPIPNVQVCILDRHLNLVPVGVAGELHIGGVGLARGYHDRPDLTAEKFIPHPFAPEAGARLYKTGDSARWLAGGTIEFLGRLDHQVKIRDFRIELGEIEAVLTQHPAMRQAVVMAREDTPGDKRLVAYLAPHQQPPPVISDLRIFLKKKLPEYMLPSAFVLLDALPLTPNGKVDRRALPAPEQDRPELTGSFVAARNPTEEAVAKIWAEVLRLECVGIRDNFFDLGGHSLLATQIVSRIRTAFETEVPLRALFDNPTVEELAAVIAQGRPTEAANSDLARMVVELERLSDEEAKSLLKKKTAGKNV